MIIISFLQKLTKGYICTISHTLKKNTHIKICYKIYHIKYTIEKYVIWTIKLR